MAKRRRNLRERLEEYVAGLSAVEVREQLVLAFLQMERCQMVLRGEDVEPVAMKDNGESSDLELFYMCKKVAQERSVDKDGGDEDDYGGCDLAFEILGDKIWRQFNSYMEEIFGTSDADEVEKRIFSSGDEVYYYSGGIRKSAVCDISFDSGRKPMWTITLTDGSVLHDLNCLFRTRDELVVNLKKSVDGEGD